MKLDVTIESSNYLASFDSSAGAVCYRLYHKPTNSDILRTPCSEEDLEKNRFLFGNPILFPPNRIRGGIFTFEDQTYRLPINEPHTGSHLHGELHRMPFKIAALSKSSVTFFYQAKAGEYLGFPHAFEVRRIYTLSDDCGLRETTEIMNLSQKTMPVMLAYHTTFQIPFSSNGTVSDYVLQLPVGRLHKRDQHYLPTCEYEDGELNEMLRIGTFVPCEHTVSAFFEASGKTMRLLDRQKSVAICYKTEGFRYWMLYNGGNQSFITVEPQTCAIDAFHIDQSYSRAGVKSLPPYQTISFVTEIGLEKTVL